LQNTVYNNYQTEGDTVFWDAVLKGTEHTINISQSMQKRLDPGY